MDNDVGGGVTDDQDFTFGLYLHGGVQYDLSETIAVGADFRSVIATDLDLETINGDADYNQIMLTLSFSL